MILITGAIQALPETVEELWALSLEHVARSRLEPGCLSHEVARSGDDPLRLIFVERWADGDAVRAHFALEASQTFAAAAGTLGASAPELALYEATPARL